MKHPDSIIAINLKACNRFRLANGRAAENELKSLIRIDGIFGDDLIMHNLVVFRNGEGALQVLPKLIDVIPEARLNLTMHYLRSGKISKAQDLMNLILKPTVPTEYILKAVVHTLLAQELDSVCNCIINIIIMHSDQKITITGQKYYFFYIPTVQKYVHFASLKVFCFIV